MKKKEWEKWRRELREKLIDKIEAEAGTLLSVPYSEITTTDLLALATALGYKQTIGENAHES